MQKTKILCLTYGKLYDLAKKAVDSIIDQDVQVDILDGMNEDLYQMVEEKLYQGADIFVAGGTNAEFVKNHFDLPVVEIDISPFDYAYAITQAKTTGNNICIVKYEQDHLYSFDLIEKITGTKVPVLNYSDPSEIQEIIRHNNAQVIVGGGYATEVAESLGKKSILIYPGENTIRTAILKAHKLHIELKKEQENNHLLRTLLHHIPNAIIIIDNKGNIIEFNQEAEQKLEKSQQQVRHKNVADIFPCLNLNQALSPDFSRQIEMKKINEKMFVEKQIQLKNDERITGAISLLSEVSDLKKAEFKYHIEKEKSNRLKGFHAKSNFSDIIGSSKALRETIFNAKLYAKSDANILITGETGTGKEIFAQSIHNGSSRSQEPFLAINCAALPENLLESELFGYEEGAFTGSRKGGKMGIFELASHGTIFLDEIGELSLPLQARLLRVLQEKEVLRIGGDRLYKINARVLSATNKDIYKIGNNAFRRDLLYRLNVLEIHIPSLRERPSDITELFSFFLLQKLDLLEQALPMPDSFKKILETYSWTGNIRELQNVCERFHLFMLQNQRRDDKSLQKNITKAIGEDQIINSLLQRYGYSSLRSLENNADGKEIYMELKTLLPLSNDMLAKKLGISRTTAWRLTKGK